MTDFKKGIYKIISTNAGFSKVERPDGVLHNLSRKTIEILKNQDGIKFVKVEIVEGSINEGKKADSNKKQESKQESKAGQLNKLKLADLIELAKRLGLESVDDKMTKKQLIEYIVENDK